MTNCGKMMSAHLERLTAMTKKVMQSSNTGSVMKAGSYVSLKAKGSRVMSKAL